MLLFLHFPADEQSLLESASAEIGVSHRCRYEPNLDMLFDLAKGNVTHATRAKFPAVVFLNADAQEHKDSLKSLKTHPVLNRIPVVCLGHPKSQVEVVNLYEAGANSYIEKPQDYETLVKVAGTALSYWLETTLLPQAHLEDL